MRFIAVVLACLLGGATAAAAQAIVVEGSTRHQAARILRGIAERDAYQLIDRDTVLPADFRREGDLVIVDAAVRLEGAVTGSVAVVGGELYLRPGAAIGGIALAVDATISTSALATVGDTLSLPPGYVVDLVRSGDDYRLSIRPPRLSSPVVPMGVFGLLAPSYDRVDGLTLRLGGGTSSLDTAAVRLRAVGSYHSARGAFGGRLEARAPIGSRVHGYLVAGRETLTPDAWIRGDISNSMSALLLGTDVRNYYESDYVSIIVAQLPPLRPTAGRPFLLPRVALTASRDRSLRAHDPWALGGGDWTENPEVFDGVLTTATGGFTIGYEGSASRLASSAQVEWGFPSPEDFAWGERQFVQAAADAQWTGSTFWNHTLTLRGHALGNLGPQIAPPQRWSHVGGSGTLPTLRQAELRGDNLVFIESTWAVPLAAINLPLLGTPELAIRHAAGSAWISDAGSRRWEQNLAAGAKLRFVELFLYLDPGGHDADPTLSVAFQTPF